MKRCFAFCLALILLPILFACSEQDRKPEWKTDLYYCSPGGGAFDAALLGESGISLLNTSFSGTEREIPEPRTDYAFCGLTLRLTPVCRKWIASSGQWADFYRVDADAYGEETPTLRLYEDGAVTVRGLTLFTVESNGDRAADALNLYAQRQGVSAENGTVKTTELPDGALFAELYRDVGGFRKTVATLTVSADGAVYEASAEAAAEPDADSPLFADADALTAFAERFAAGRDDLADTVTRHAASRIKTFAGRPCLELILVFERLSPDGSVISVPETFVIAERESP